MPRTVDSVYPLTRRAIPVCNRLAVARTDFRYAALKPYRLKMPPHNCETRQGCIIVFPNPQRKERCFFPRPKGPGIHAEYLMKNTAAPAWRHPRIARTILALGLIAALCSCAHRELRVPSGASDVTTRALRSKIDTIVVIYAENRAFDNLYGNFPGARGLGEVVGSDGRPLPAYVPQIDRDGSVLPALPPTWGGVTAP